MTKENASFGSAWASHVSVEALNKLFADGTLIRPSDRSANLVHLVRAIATLCGVPDVNNSPAVGELIKAIDVANDSQHLIFVLVDGLGMNLIRQLPEDSFLRRSLRREMHATCPSTTACALTTVATAQYPSQHAVTGWFTYLPELELTAAILPFSDRATGQPLAQRGIKPRDVLPGAPINPRMNTRQPLTLSPNYIANTVYNVYSRGGTSGLGYESLTDAIDKAIAHINDAQWPSYVHLYLHDVDTLCHHVGVNHESVVPLVLGIDAELSRLHETVRERARIVITADHGLINVPRENQTLLGIGADGAVDPLLDLLIVPPTGDARMPIFHVRPGQHDAFPRLFQQRMEDRMLLLRTDDAERMELFGPAPMSPVARRRFGDFVGIPYQPVTLAYHPPHKPLGELYL